MPGPGRATARRRGRSSEDETPSHPSSTDDRPSRSAERKGSARAHRRRSPPTMPSATTLLAEAGRGRRPARRRQLWPTSCSATSRRCKVTMDEMLHHARAVGRDPSSSAMLIADMPWMSYHVSPVEDAVRNAARFVREAGADAVKLEGRREAASRRSRAPRLGGDPGDGPPRPDAAVGVAGWAATSVQGPDAEDRARDVARRTRASVEARPGCFAHGPRRRAGRRLPRRITARRYPVPTIGIGAGAGCDGQVLVYPRSCWGCVAGPARRSSCGSYAEIREQTRVPDALRVLGRPTSAAGSLPRRRGNLRVARWSSIRRDPCDEGSGLPSGSCQRRG